MANTVLTPSDTPDEAIEVPTPADPVRAGEAVGATVGTVRLGFRRLFNKIHSIFVGRVYLRSLRLTTSGAAVGTRIGDGDLPPAGTVVVSRTTSSATLPNSTCANGELTKEHVLMAWAVIASDGTVMRSINVESAARTADPGEYEIVLKLGSTSYETIVASLTTRGITSKRILSYNAEDSGGGRVKLLVRAFDLNGDPANAQFAMVVWGAQ